MCMQHSLHLSGPGHPSHEEDRGRDGFAIQRDIDWWIGSGLRHRCRMLADYRLHRTQNSAQYGGLLSVVVLHSSFIVPLWWMIVPSCYFLFFLRDWEPVSRDLYIILLSSPLPLFVSTSPCLRACPCQRVFSTKNSSLVCAVFMTSPLFLCNSNHNSHESTLLVHFNFYCAWVWERDRLLFPQGPQTGAGTKGNSAQDIAGSLSLVWRGKCSTQSRSRQG